MSGIVAPVIAGLVVGMGFVFMFSIWGSDQTKQFENINISRYLEGRERDELTTHEKLMLRILLQNATVQELFEGKQVVITGIADMGNRCEFGNCGRVDLIHEDYPKGLRIVIDYTNNRVVTPLPNG